MFAAFIDTARAVRKPLVVGYSLLLVLWILFGDGAGATLRQDAFGRRIADGLATLGPATEFALVSILAGAIGAAVLRLALDEVVLRIQHAMNHPRWGQYISTARVRVRHYEEQTENGSAHWAQFLNGEVERRERQRADSELRTIALLCLVTVALAAAIEGGGRWWALLLTMPLVVAIDLWAINRGEWRAITSELKDEVEGRIEAIRSGAEDLEREQHARYATLHHLDPRDRIEEFERRHRKLSEGKRASTIEIMDAELKDVELLWADF